MICFFIYSNLPKTRHTFFLVISLILIFQQQILTVNNISRNDRPVLLIVGTRPEGIKMAPLYYALKNNQIPTLFCSTGQHSDLLNEVLRLFDITPDFDLAIMKPNQDLFYLTNTLLIKLKDIIKETNPSLVVVQGDTTTAMVGALAAFYMKIPVAHVEAGLRTGNIYMPFPEEINRRFISNISKLNFAPTKRAEQNLINEGIKPQVIFCTGNTVVDALFIIKTKITKGILKISNDLKEMVLTAKKKGQKLILLTTHRRESFGIGLENIFSAVKSSLQQNKNLYIIYPVHPNPQISKSLKQAGLDTINNIKIIKPLTYSDMIFLMMESDGIATDSGGIQEEGITLGKQILILRNETERPEGVESGMAELVGTDREKIRQGIAKMLGSQININLCKNIYGNGDAAIRIALKIKETIGY